MAERTCASVDTTATSSECRGLKLNGVDVALAAVEATTICGVVTGRGYQKANGLGSVPLHLRWEAGAWALHSSAASPMQNLTCER